MKIFTKNNLIILATVFFAISAIFGSVALSSSVKILEPTQNRIWYFSSQTEEKNTDMILRALWIIDSDIEPIVESKSSSISNHKESFDKNMDEFYKEVETLNKQIVMWNRFSLFTFVIALLISVIAIVRKE